MPDSVCVKCRYTKSRIDSGAVIRCIDTDGHVFSPTPVLKPTLQPGPDSPTFAQAATIIYLLQEVRDNLSTLIRIHQDAADAEEPR